MGDKRIFIQQYFIVLFIHLLGAHPHHSSCVNVRGHVRRVTFLSALWVPEINHKLSDRQQPPLPAEPSLQRTGGLKRRISLRLVAFLCLVVPGFQENVEMGAVSKIEGRRQAVPAVPFKTIQVSPSLYLFP